MANVNRLPDAYFKGTSGNNYKMLHLNELATNELSEDITKVLNSLDLMTATGKTLDLYGDMVKQPRGALNDEQYRLMILNKIGQNICQGNYNSIISILSNMFGCTPSDIIIVDSEETCKAEVTKFPLEVLVNSGFSSEQAVKMIELLLPVCVKLSTANFNGTFEFGDTVEEAPSTYSELALNTNEQLQDYTYNQLATGKVVVMEYDKEKGFGNIEQTIGGYFGLVLGDKNQFELPI